MDKRTALPLVLAFAAAAAVATVWGAIVQTQFNLAGLASIGAVIPAGLRLRSTMADIFGGFSPTYAGYVVIPSLLVGFGAASWVAGRLPAWRLFWFGLAGGLAILLGIPIVNFLSPVALLIGASRDLLCTVLMALGGVAGGLLFGRASRRVVVAREPGAVREGREPAAAR